MTIGWPERIRPAQPRVPSSAARIGSTAAMVLTCLSAATATTPSSAVRAMISWSAAMGATPTSSGGRWHRYDQRRQHGRPDHLHRRGGGTDAEHVLERRFAVLGRDGHGGHGGQHHAADQRRLARRRPRFRARRRHAAHPGVPDGGGNGGAICRGWCPGGFDPWRVGQRSDRRPRRRRPPARRRRCRSTVRRLLQRDRRGLYRWRRRR